MLQEDVVDVLWEALKKYRVQSDGKTEAAPATGRQGKRGDILGKPYNQPYTSLSAGRIFLSEREIKLMIQGQKTLKLPSKAIVSPLAQEWLALKRIPIVIEE